MSRVRFRRGSWSNLIDPEFFDDDVSFGHRRRRRRMNVPALNIKETDEAFEIELAAPGFSKKDFEVTSDDGFLHISAESSTTSEEEENNYTRQEFSYRSFEKSFELPDSVKEEDIKAKYKDGVLSFNLLKKEETKDQKPKKIEVA